MPGARQQRHDLERQDDLDAAAAAYARQWTQAGVDLRGRLRDDLIRDCVPFADRIARRYSGRSEHLDDLEQVARLGLIKTVDRYDPGRGSFTAFAVITIQGEIKRHFRDRTWAMHVNRRMQDLALETGHAAAELTQTLAHTPSAAELARHLEVSEDDVRAARECAAGRNPLSLSTPVGDEGTQELGDLVGDRDQSLEALPDKVTVAELIRVLPTRIQHLISLRFFGNLTQAQIAAECGISQMHVSRLLSHALGWLRSAMLSDVPPPWTGMDETHGLDSLRIRVKRTAPAVTVEVAGEVDRDTADRLRLRLHTAVTMAAPAGRVVIDIAGVPLLDAAGVAVLEDARRTAALAHVGLSITGAQQHVAYVLAALGLPSAARAA